MIPAKLNIIQRINKSGVSYQVMEIWITTKEGEVVNIHEVYIRDSLKQILEILTKDIDKVEKKDFKLTGEVL